MARRDQLLRRHLRERFVVTMSGGASFEGVLLEADDKTLQLVDARALDGEQRLVVDGAVFLPRDGVAYMQKPGEAR
jgi:hypothetical protein